MDDDVRRKRGFDPPAASVKSRTAGRGSLEGRLRFQGVTSVLIVDGDAELLGALGEHLRRNGFTVMASRNSTDALAKLARQRPDAVITDLFAPGLHGLTVCREAAGMSVPPVVLVTAAEAGSEDRIAAFLAGATDFLIKPFELDELVARIAAHLRNAARREKRTSLSFAGVRVDLHQGAATVHGSPVHLPRAQLHVLACMLKNLGRVLSHAELRKAAESAGDTRAGQKLVQRLRNALIKAGVHPSFITAVPGTGYGVGLELLVTPKSVA